MLPELAKGEANKIWVIPSEFTQALSGLSGAMSRVGTGEAAAPPPPSADREPPATANEHRPDDAARSLPPGAPPAP